MSLGLGFEYQGLPPQPVITVIEPGGAADRAGYAPVPAVQKQMVLTAGVPVSVSGLLRICHPKKLHAKECTKPPGLNSELDMRGESPPWIP